MLNFLTLGSGELVARGLQAVAFILLARAVGSTALGQLGLATAITSYVVILVLQGFDPIAIRDVSRHAERAIEFIRVICGLRLLFAVLAFFLTGVYAFEFQPGVQRTLLIILAISYVTNALSPRWAFVAVARTKPLAIATAFSQACFLLAVLMIKGPGQLIWAPVGQIAGEIGAAIILWFSLPAGSESRWPRLDRTFSIWILRESWPVSLGLILGNLLYNFDVFALGAFRRTAEIGLYLACCRFISAVSPLLGAFQQTILPGFSRSYPDFGLIKTDVWRLSVAALFVLGSGSALLWLYARPVLGALFGDGFASGAGMLRILIWVVPIQGVRAILRQVLVSYRLQQLDLWGLSFALAVNVILDVILIPRMGAMGCAISTLTSEALLCVFCAAIVQNKVNVQRV